MVRAPPAFLDFCYLVCQPVHTEALLLAVQGALSRFHQDWVIFENEGIRPAGLSLPWQHSLVHYKLVIQQFGSLNGLCSSITESKHIRAIKEPWRQSNHFEALGQMLITNQQLNKLAATWVDFAACGMLDGPCVAANVDIVSDGAAASLEEDNGPVAGSKIMVHVTLAKCSGMNQRVLPCECAITYCIHLHSLWLSLSTTSTFWISQSSSSWMSNIQWKDLCLPLSRGHILFTKWGNVTQKNTCLSFLAEWPSLQWLSLCN